LTSESEADLETQRSEGIAILAAILGVCVLLSLVLGGSQVGSIRFANQGIFSVSAVDGSEGSSVGEDAPDGGQGATARTQAS
jgi:hypothetical protein